MKTFNYTTTSKTILADLYTPVGVYMRLRDIYPQSALMESSDYHDSNNSRSFIGIGPLASVAIGHGKATIAFPDGTTESHEVNKTYQSDKAIHALIDCIKVEGDHSNVCGLYGYTSFNAVRYFEDIAVKDETQAKNDAPDMLYILYKVVIVFDHFNNQLTVVSLTPSDLPQNGEADLDNIMRAMNKANVKAYDFHPVGDVRSTLTNEEHKANIRKGIQHCLRGDVFQIVLSRRFIQQYEGDDFKLYRALRSINPSPYLFYFDFGGFRIFGSSPETHCRIEGDKVYIDPIAGTTKRTGDAEADRQGAEYLRNDPKENAEHVMLVDLARNDLSRNCHDVKVDARRGRRPHQGLYRHLPSGHALWCTQSQGDATDLRVRASQSWRLWRLHRLYRPRWQSQPSHHHPHVRQPQQRIVVPSWWRHRGQEQ